MKKTQTPTSSTETDAEHAARANVAIAGHAAVTGMLRAYRVSLQVYAIVAITAMVALNGSASLLFIGSSLLAERVCALVWGTGAVAAACAYISAFSAAQHYGNYLETWDAISVSKSNDAQGIGKLLLGFSVALFWIGLLVMTLLANGR